MTKPEARDVDPHAHDADRARGAARPRVVILIVGAALLLGSVALGMWIYWHGDPPFPVDVWWNDALADRESTFLTSLSLFMNWAGGGVMSVFIVPIAGAIALFLVRRPWSALYFLVASAASAGVVQLMKGTFGRARPEELVVLADVGSYPSGHVANAATIAVAAVIIFPRLWVGIVGAVWIIVMAFSRTYLHAHWLSDTLGGAMVGAGVALVAAAAFGVLLAREPLEKIFALR